MKIFSFCEVTRNFSKDIMIKLPGKSLTCLEFQNDLDKQPKSLSSNLWLPSIARQFNAIFVLYIPQFCDRKIKIVHISMCIASEAILTELTQDEKGDSLSRKMLFFFFFPRIFLLFTCLLI